MTEALSHKKLTEWQKMPEDLQTALAQQALRRAALIVAEQAELFAVQFVGGTLQDRGASDALLLFAALLRETTIETLTPMGFGVWGTGGCFGARARLTDALSRCRRPDRRRPGRRAQARQPRRSAHRCAGCAAPRPGWP